MKRILMIFSIAAMLLNVTGAKAQDTTTLVTAKRIGTDSLAVTFNKVATTDTMTVFFLCCVNPAFTGIVYNPSFVMHGASGTYTHDVFLAAGSVYYVKIVTYDSSNHIYDTSNTKLMVTPISTNVMPLPNTDGYTSTTITNPGNDTVTETHQMAVAPDSMFSSPYTYEVRTVFGTSSVTSLDTLEGLGINDTVYDRVIIHSVHGYFPDDTVKQRIVTGTPASTAYVGLYGYPSSTDTSIDMDIVINNWGVAGSHPVFPIRSTSGGVYTDSIVFPTMTAMVGAQYIHVHKYCSIPAHTYYFDFTVSNIAGVGYMGTHSYATLITPAGQSLSDSALNYDTATTTATLIQNYSNVMGNTSNITVAHWYAGSIVYTTPYLGVSGVGTQSTSFAISPTDTGMHAFFGWDNDVITGLTVHSDTMWLHIYPAPTHTFAADSLTKAYNTKDTIAWAGTNMHYTWIGSTLVANSGHIVITVRQDTTVYYKGQGFDGSITLDSIAIHADSSNMDTTTATYVATQTVHSAVAVYPNPTTDYLIIDPGTAQNYACTITDQTGRVLQNFTITGKTKHTVNLTDGVYFLSMETGTTKETRTIIVQTR